MKMIFLSIMMLLSVLILASCKKQDIKLTPLASLLVTNAVSGGGNLVLGTNAVPVYNNNFQTYGMLTGSREVKLLDTAVGINKVYYNQTKDFVNGGMYSLFLGGTPAAVESVFIKEENIPSHTADVFGARVINLVTGGAPISVNVQGSPNGSFVNSLAHKAISTFKDISSLAAEGDKVFEFRNAATGDLITSFTVPGYDLPRFRNITLVFAGSVDNESIIRTNNY
ncbi:hypothetical protein [Pedobacter sp.]|jgi:hypothetical protein|uniref:hypothetical protein n=1 Tax=Pedobacter sp. TaxID=1411316 RepID=UPI002B5286D6|nr:hypothetical protein [Pedobacter sp.]HWW41460.1 hypothetical protein [Pedobacter sp.]